MRTLLLVLTALFVVSPLVGAAKGPIPKGGFKSCKAAKAAGYRNIKRGEPAYHPRLDRDQDGLACDK
jgi:Excalibur calcium-binding domain